MKLSKILGLPERDLSKLTETEKRDIAMKGIDRLVALKKQCDEEDRQKLYGKGLKLNLGCGNRKIKDFINIDCREVVKPDILWDLEDGLPTNPIPDNSVSYVFASNIMEHLRNFIPLMEDIYRVCMNGATVNIIVPHYRTHTAFSDPTHIRFFTEHTFQYFSQVQRQLNQDNFDYDFKCDFEIESVGMENGLMRVVLKAEKEDSNANRRKENRKKNKMLQ